MVPVIQYFIGQYQFPLTKECAMAKKNKNKKDDKKGKKDKKKKKK